MISESQLITNLISSDKKEEAFKELLALYKKPLYWHIRKIVISHDDADDVLQNTFIKVFKNISGFKGESKIYSWMYRIATNEAISFLNSKAKKYNISTETLKSNTINMLESDIYFEGDAIQLKLQKAIATLPEKQQLVFNLKYFEEHTYENLSEILNTSIGALKSSYHLAVKKITQYLTTH